MTTPEVPKFGIKFPSRKERIVKRVTKCETREIQKRIYFVFSFFLYFIFILQGLEPPKPARVRPPPKPKTPKKPKPATLIKPLRPSRNTPSTRSPTKTTSKQPAARTLQISDVEKLARLNCSREFGLFHQSIKNELSKAYENQLAFLQTKLQHLKNEFVNKQAEHLNFEQIKEYYEQAVKDHIRRNIKPDEYLTLAEKFKQDTKQVKYYDKKE